MQAVGNITGGNIITLTGTVFSNNAISYNTVTVANTAYLAFQTTTSNANFVALQGPSSIASTSISWSLPNTAGTVGQFLTTNGSGQMQWSASLASSTAPTTAGSAGTAGQIAYDSNYIYVCVATNTWKRASLASWP